MYSPATTRSPNPRWTEVSSCFRSRLLYTETCNTVHLYTCSPVHGDLLQVHLAQPAQLHLLGPHVHTEVARSSLKVKSAVREKLRISTFHPKLYTQYTYTIYTIYTSSQNTWLMSRGSMGDVSPVSSAASVVLPPSPEESSLVICKARSEVRGEVTPGLGSRASNELSRRLKFYNYGEDPINTVA